MATDTLAVLLVADCAPAQAALEELLQAPEDRIHLLLQGIGGISQLVRVDLDVIPAGAAGARWVLFQPSDALLRFLTAMPAGNVQRLVVEDVLHEFSVSDGVEGGTENS